MTLYESDQRPEDLIQAYLDGSLALDEAETLLAILKSDPDLVDILINGLRTDILIQSTARRVEEEVAAGDKVEPGDEKAGVTGSGAKPTDENEVHRIKEYAAHQLELFLAEQEQQRRQEKIETRVPHFTLNMQEVAVRVNRVITITKKAAVLLAACVVVAMVLVVPVKHALSHRVVATLGDTVNAQWSVDLQTKELRPGWMTLEQGFAQLVFKRGAEVILQAPAVFQLQSANSLLLEKGRMTARVPKQARGFKVETTKARVIDYGTEFGVLVGAEDSAEVHVFDGHIGLTSTSQAGNAQSQRLQRGEAATVDSNGHIERGALSNRPALFVREIPKSGGLAIAGKQLNLADMVGRGNGLDTGVIGQGINPLTGEKSPTRELIRARGNGFVFTSDLPFIDGVFVPGSGPSPMVVSSTGITCQANPEASGFCYEGILNGALFQYNSSRVHRGRLAGNTYGTREHPSIGIHANAGITFDLNEIRSALPEVEMTGFRSLCGISETVARYSDGTWESRPIKVTFWVLMDGRVRFSQTLTAVPSEPEWMHVPIDPKDRFLTLMTTSTDPNSTFCWSMLADPALELTAKQRE